MHTKHTILLALLIAITSCQIYRPADIPLLGHTTIDETMQWIATNIEYLPDTRLRDEYQAPAETYFTRRGDCEDFALLALYLVNQEHGIKGEMWFGYPEDGVTGHAWVAINDTHWEVVYGQKTTLLAELYPRLCMHFSYHQAMLIAGIS